MDIKPYVKITISRHKGSDHNKGEVLRTLDLPRELVHRNQYRIAWISSSLHAQNYGYHVSTAYHYYDKKTGIDISYKSTYSLWVSAKGQVKKWENKLAQFEQNWQPTLLIQSIEQDERYQAAQEKLERKREQLEDIAAKLKAEAEKLNQTQPQL